MAHITKRKTAVGEARYDVRVRIGGKERSKTFERLRDAKAYGNTIEAERLSGYLVDPAGGRMTLEALSERWLVSNPGKRANTVGRDRSALRAHIVPAIGNRQLRSLRQGDMQDLVNSWSQILAPKTVHRTYGTLRAALAYAVNSELIPRSPCRNIKLPQLERKTSRVLTAGDIGALANATDERYRGMVWIAALLGLRWGEVAGLRVSRLDVPGRTLSVAEIVTRDAQGRTVLGPPKSVAGNRILSLPSVLVDILAIHLAETDFGAAGGDAFVFPAPGGLPWSYSNYRRRIWLPAVQRAELSGIGFHDLRRMAATALVLERVDMKTAQTRLGHSDPRLTLAVYAQATTEADRAAAEAVAGRFAEAIGESLGGHMRDARGMTVPETRISGGRNPR
jgi:integrase